ncbi:amidohydrolase family protein [Isoptericola halotolerans]|uniref:N-acyl-D-amino-acid deacylase n=1 Tax=Isoptericola halotolerans TaxID=300560 RepID=A0ABX2A4A0_9MICO|nr:amidohydrolase family protein [Isoptericola halotolerans]NOV96602.1 N-acyl-D-amino-acid deacylase [Isoptericola halotolerans]
MNRWSVDVVRGAVLPRPDGSLTAPQDVLLDGGRVRAVERAGRRHGERVLDAEGRLVLPGFVDAHVHGGGAVFDPGVQHALLRQGVTAIVTGADGVGFAPSDDAGAAWAADYFAGIDGDHPGFGGGSLAGLLATYDGATPVNVAALVPHGTLRRTVVGTDPRAATPGEISRMVAMARQGFADGAVGLSTGLEYVPAAWARDDELRAVVAVAAEHGLPHVSHMRGYEDRAGPALAELLDLAAATGAATHVSHLHGPAEPILAVLDGVDVTFDSYPYLRGCSLLAMVALPTWLPLADPDATVAALDAPASARRLRDHLEGLHDLWPRVTLAWVPGLDPHEGDVAGRALTDVAADWGVPPSVAALRVLRASRLRASCVFAQPPTGTAAALRTLANHPGHLAGSDAIYQPVGAATAHGRPHPRGWGAFARLLAEQVRATGDWTWHDAAEHLSARAARRFALAGRGSVSAGAVADLVLVDPEAVADRATYDDPRALAVGIDDVLVAGRRVLTDGELTRARPGRGLRAATKPRTDRADHDRSTP